MLNMKGEIEGIGKKNQKAIKERDEYGRKKN